MNKKLTSADVLGIVVKRSSRKLIHHTWEHLTDTNKFKHVRCTRCHCEGYYDPAFHCYVYYDRFGKMSFQRPDCVLPNTKI